MRGIKSSPRPLRTFLLALAFGTLCSSAVSGQTKKPVPPKPAAPAPAKPAAPKQTAATPAGTTPSGTTPASTTPQRQTQRGSVPGQPNQTQPSAPGIYDRKTGGTVTVDRAGNQTERNGTGQVTAVQRPGMTAHFDQQGRPQDFQRTRGNTVQTMRRLPGNGRYFESTRPGPGGVTRVAAYGPRRGFLEAPMAGRPGFTRRTYMAGDHRYAVLYRNHRYLGHEFARPVPAVIYSPGYYAWAVQPWAAPVGISIGFQAAPWYGSYGRVFTPYDQYARPDQWMTDQILANNMQQAYDAGRTAQANIDSGSPQDAMPPQISPQLKNQIDGQVRYDVQEQAREAQGGAAAVVPPDLPPGQTEPDQLPDALKPYHMVFRVVAPLSVQADGQPCTLSPDDWVVRTSNLNAEDGTVSISVSASRTADCPVHTSAKVTLNDLMAMENDMNEQVAATLALAAKSMGKDGMPVGPSSGATVVPGGRVDPDPAVASSLQQAQSEGSAAEQQVAATKGQS